LKRDRKVTMEEYDNPKNRARILGSDRRAEWLKVSEILEKAKVAQGMVCVDLGCGAGPLSLPLAEKVGRTGKVYAVDTNQEFLDFVKQQAIEQGLSNVITLCTSSEQPDLPHGLFDMVFLRNVTHHLPNRVDYFRRLKEMLRPRGTLVIIEFDGRGGLFSFQRRLRHYIPYEVLLEETKQAGYVLQNSYDFLSEQSLMIFFVE